MNQSSNFLGGKTKSQKMLFFENRLIHFHINRNSVIRPVKQNQLSFFSIEVNKLLSALAKVSYRSNLTSSNIQNHLKPAITEKKTK